MDARYVIFPENNYTGYSGSLNSFSLRTQATLRWSVTCRWRVGDLSLNDFIEFALIFLHMVQIGPLRAWPGGICLSRTIGDIDAGQCIVPVPHVKQIKVSQSPESSLWPSLVIHNHATNKTAINNPAICTCGYALHIWQGGPYPVIRHILF